MSSTMATFLFELANFLLLAAMLGWLLFRPVRSALAARQAAERRQGEEIAKKTAEAERARADLEQRQKRFEDEMTKARADRLAAAERESTAIVAKAKEAADHERERLTRTLGQIERVQLERLGSAVAEASRSAVAHLLTTLGHADLGPSLALAARRQIERLDHGPLGEVLIESAGPLGPDDRTAFEHALGDRAASTDFRLTPALGAGVRITTARGVIDASAAGLAGVAQRTLTAKLASDSTEPGR
jgi:F-type H+-transporting ATPase subunit b